ncbi:MAG: hypothetical protein K2Q97_08085 [Burkholderiaceae bacterium]|nr:hypothetical protein [Burkholderiaceae bacterium]
MLFSKAFGLAVAASAVVVLGGCAQRAPIPVAENFEYTSQPKVRSAGHWDLVSRDVVGQTLNSLDKAGVAPNTPMYVVAPVNATQFEGAFHDFVVTKLVQSGAVVLQNRGQGLEVSYGIKVVRHNSDRPRFIPGQFTMLAAGLFSAYGLRYEHIDTQLAAGLGLSVAADYANSVNSGGPTNTELILTTTVTHGGQYLARKTDVYYLENADTPLFTRPSPTYRNVDMKVVAQ